MRQASASYLADVKSQGFPTMANCSTMPHEVLAKFQAEVLGK
jgi:hypothetical protein